MAADFAANYAAFFGVNLAVDLVADLAKHVASILAVDFAKRLVNSTAFSAVVLTNIIEEITAVSNLT